MLLEIRNLACGYSTEKPVISVEYDKEDAGKWRMTDGLGGRTLTFTLLAEPESRLRTVLLWEHIAER